MARARGDHCVTGAERFNPEASERSARAAMHVPRSDRHLDLSRTLAALPTPALPRPALRRSVAKGDRRAGAMKRREGHPDSRCRPSIWTSAGRLEFRFGAWPTTMPSTEQERSQRSRVWLSGPFRCAQARPCDEMTETLRFARGAFARDRQVADFIHEIQFMTEIGH